MTDLLSRPVFGVKFSLSTQAEIAEIICSGTPEIGAGLKLFVTTNLDHVVKLRRNPQFAQAYSRAWKAVIDGSPILLYARLRGARVPERVTGADLFPEILDRLSPARHRPYFVASKPHSAAFIEKWLLDRGFLSGQFGIDVPPFGFDSDPVGSAELASKIRQVGTTHLFLGVGCPKSELWADRHRHDLGDLYAFCFGAALEFFSGTTRRAPRIFQTLCIEWMWRLMQEPARLSNRYLVNSWEFLPAICEDIRFDGRVPIDKNA
jgi:N-acetylglucosaminyldiphosphoundecaprenol N-acetyl-beta-D-mannosaminyltransferase